VRIERMPIGDVHLGAYEMYGLRAGGALAEEAERERRWLKHHYHWRTLLGTTH